MKTTDEIWPHHAFGLRLKAALEYANVDSSQRTIGKRWDVSGAFVGKMLRCEALPGSSTLSVIAKDLRVSGDWLLTGMGKMPAPRSEDPSIAEVLQIMSRLDPEARAELVAMVKWLESRSKL